MPVSLPSSIYHLPFPRPTAHPCLLANRGREGVQSTTMRSIATDVGYAVRMFIKKPAFALTAIFTLALGIGAAAAIFSVMNAVLLKPLPYADPERLVHVANDLRARNVEDFPWPGPDFHDLRTTSTQFSGLAGLVTGRQVFVPPGRADAEPVTTGGATPNLFRVLGARMAMGSDFVDADGTPPPPQPDGAAQADGPPQNQNPPRTILS